MTSCTLDLRAGRLPEFIVIKELVFWEGCLQVRVKVIFVCMVWPRSIYIFHPWDICTKSCALLYLQSLYWPSDEGTLTFAEELNHRKMSWFGNKRQGFKYTCVYLPSLWVHSPHSQTRKWTRVIWGVSSGAISGFRTWSQESLLSVITVVGPPEQLFPALPPTPQDTMITLINSGMTTGSWVYSYCFT